MFLVRDVGIFTFLCFLHFGLLGVPCAARITDEEYARMPPVFEMDDFDRCMQFGSKALYCLARLDLYPLKVTNHSKVWDIIQKSYINSVTFRHDIVQRGICIPLTCSNISGDVIRHWDNKAIMRDIVSECYNIKIAKYGLTSKITKDLHIRCESAKPIHQIDYLDTSVRNLITLLLTVIIFASIYEGLARTKPKKEYDQKFSSLFAKIIACFSLPKNWDSLTRFDNSAYEKALSSIQGVRIILALGVILFHSVGLVYFIPTVNTRAQEVVLPGLKTLFLLNGGFLIQIFLLISGMMLSYHHFLIMEKHKTIKLRLILLAAVNRYIRLTPCVLLMLAKVSTWRYHMNRSPNWENLIGQEYRNCRKNWWVNLLYINNFFNLNAMCLPETWYLAADFQLYIASLFIIMLIWMCRSYTKTILGIAVAAGIALPGIKCYIYNLPMHPRLTLEELQSYTPDVPTFQHLYIPSYCNAGAFFMGLTLGYLYYTYRDNYAIAKTKIFQLIYWTFGCGLPFCVLLTAYVTFYAPNSDTRLGSALFAALGRNLYALGIGILIFGTTINGGGYLRRFLQWKIFQSLGRLTYCIYMVHFSMMRIRVGTERYPHYVSNFVQMSDSIMDVVFSLIGGTILCLCVELPASGLQKLLIPQVKYKTDEKTGEEKSK